MIQRIALRMGDFVGTTARRTIRAVEELVPGVEPPRETRRIFTPARAVMGVAAAAAGLVSSNGSTRREIVDRAKGPADGLSRARSGSSSGSGRASSNGSAGRKAASTTKRTANRMVDLTAK